MKKLLLAPIALAVALFANAQPQFQINGQISGGKEGMKVYLRNADIPDKKILDSTTLHNGSFVFRGRTDSPRFCVIWFYKLKNGKIDPDPFTQRALSLFVENCGISIKTCYDSLPVGYDFFNSGGLGNPPGTLITGSASYDKLTEYVNQKRRLDQELSALENDMHEVLFPRRPSKQPRERGIQLAEAIDHTTNGLKSLALDFIKNNPPGAVTGLIALKTLDPVSKEAKIITVNDIDQVAAHFKGMKNKGAIVNRLLEKLPQAKKAALGARFIDFTYTDSTGKKHTLSEYLGKGKQVLIVTWATGCGSCRKEIPHLKELYPLYHQKGFEILYISLYDNMPVWIKGLIKEQMDWMQLLDEKVDGNRFDPGLFEAYQLSSLGNYLVFDPGGKLIAKRTEGGPWIDKMLIDLYGNHFPSSEARP